MDQESLQTSTKACCSWTLGKTHLDWELQSNFFFCSEDGKVVKATVSSLASETPVLSLCEGGIFVFHLRSPPAPQTSCFHGCILDGHDGKWSPMVIVRWLEDLSLSSTQVTACPFTVVSVAWFGSAILEFGSGGLNLASQNHQGLQPGLALAGSWFSETWVSLPDFKSLDAWHVFFLLSLVLKLHCRLSWSH